MIEEVAVRGMRRQVADVSNALQSVRARAKDRHVVMFGDGENSEDNYIVNRTTVEIEFLPPIDTSHWTAETLDQHMAELRDVYIRHLPEDQRPLEEAPVQKLAA